MFKLLKNNRYTKILVGLFLMFTGLFWVFNSYIGENAMFLIAIIYVVYIVIMLISFVIIYFYEKKKS